MLCGVVLDVTMPGLSMAQTAQADADAGKPIARTCRKAIACCDAATGGGDDACLALADQSAKQCRKQLKRYKKKVRRKAPKKMSACR